MFEFRDAEKAELEASTDRGAALLGAAYLEAAFGTRLRYSMLHESEDFGENGSEVDRVLSASGAAGTAAGRASLCYALGMISINFLSDARTVFKIRNKFAHETAVNSFEHEHIKKIMDKNPFRMAAVGTRMTEMVTKKTTTRREKFLMATSEMAAVLSRRRGRPEFNPLDWS